MDAGDKRALVTELCAGIAKSMGVHARAAHEAREAATHEEAKPENDKDTRAVEAAYLAGAQATRVRELERAAAALEVLPLKTFGLGEAITSSALVELGQEGGAHWYFLAPQGGGLRVAIRGVEVQVITPQSALGRELLGRSADDEFEVTVQGKLRTYQILRVV